MAGLAQMERELTIERTRAGLEVARNLGRKGGRKRQMTDSKIKSPKKLLASGVPPHDVAEQPRSLRADPLPLDSGFHDGLTYDSTFSEGPPFHRAKGTDSGEFLLRSTGLLHFLDEKTSSANPYG
jgi:hypothetical protein